MQLFEGKERRLAAFDHVGEERRVGDGFLHGAQLVEAARGFDEDDVSASVPVELAAADRFIEAERLAGVGAADDHEVIVAAGRYQFHPLGDLPNERAVHLGTASLPSNEGGGGSGSRSVA